ncbi:MAG: hypothetical protein QW416_06830 [Candidatus Nitrosocaldaceae archaeon]
MLDITSEDGFWSRRFDKQTFRDYRIFNASILTTANAPWFLKDSNSSRGDIFFNPAYIAKR